MRTYKLVSAEGDVAEPKDTWDTYHALVPAKLRDRTCKLFPTSEGDAWVIDEKQSGPLGLGMQADTTFEAYRPSGETYQSIRRGAYDPYEPLKDMRIDRVDAQVNFPKPRRSRFGIAKDGNSGIRGISGMMCRAIAWVIACIAVFLLAAPAAAQFTFNRPVYDALVSADSHMTIPVGTKITLENWKTYRNFMPISMQALYSGQYQYHIGSGPDYTVEVGPTRHIPLPKRYIEDTERHSQQVKLIKTPNGSYTVEGYVAGMPFPNPSGQQAGYQVFYNVFYNDLPAILYYLSGGFSIDRYGSRNGQTVDVIGYRLDHVSDPNLPALPSYGYLTSDRLLIVTPEQSKYTTEIQLIRDDPSLVQEVYVFLPSLRRPLRLSSAARCSPALGSDFVQDDIQTGTAFQATNFSLKLLGTKKVLSLAHTNQTLARSFDSYTGPGTPMPTWAKPSLGTWEVRKVYVVDVSPLPVLTGYCYGHKVLYIDGETSKPVWEDIYDQQGKLWKTYEIFSFPVELPDGEKVALLGVSTEVMIDLQNIHLSFSLPSTPITFDADVPSKYKNASVMAFPGSLTQVMQ